MSKEKSSKELAVTVKGVTRENVKKEDVPSLLAVVEAKIAELKSDNGKSPMIDVDLDEHGKISEISTREGLDKAMSSVIGKFEYAKKSREIYNQANSGVKREEFKMNGYTEDQWKVALTSQERKVSFKDELLRLEKMKDLLKKHLSDADKFKSDIGDFLSLIDIK